VPKNSMRLDRKNAFHEEFPIAASSVDGGIAEITGQNGEHFAPRRAGRKTYAQSSRV
jgi:hypothetical protein